MKNIPITSWIIDDEKASASLLELKLKNIAPAVKVTRIFSNAVDLNEAYLPDVIFLDIEMPNMDGIQFARQLSNQTEIVFTTAYAQYAIDAIDLHPIGYLLKPVNDEKLFEIITRLENKLLLKGSKRTISISTQDGIFFLEVKDIMYVQSLNNCSKFVLKNSKPLVAAKTLKSIEEILAFYPIFFRPYKSYLVNLQFVDRYIKGEGGKLIMKDGEEIEVSRQKKAELLLLLHNM